MPMGTRHVKAVGILHGQPHLLARLLYPCVCVPQGIKVVLREVPPVPGAPLVNTKLAQGMVLKVLFAQTVMLGTQHLLIRKQQTHA